MTHFYDRNRPSQVFNIGDEVLLDTLNWTQRTSAPAASESLHLALLDPTASSNPRLQPPTKSRFLLPYVCMTNSTHLFFDLIIAIPIRHSLNDVPRLITLDGSDAFHVQAIIGHRNHHGVEQCGTVVTFALMGSGLEFGSSPRAY
ncbi:TPA: hypothetical protein N0F65_001044 [Lagenidium giganteum]|uniref:Uncharacterized protein n=1 Tax=Lagenidium giganteum TaxID=4803 RepID=A0AAV2YMM0_9STRA|nr:TPA: hypothetical protein N0F65_001044 [Lagenidium giganteum]